MAWTWKWTWSIRQMAWIWSEVEVGTHGEHAVAWMAGDWYADDMGSRMRSMKLA